MIALTMSDSGWSSWININLELLQSNQLKFSSLLLLKLQWWVTLKSSLLVWIGRWVLIFRNLEVLDLLFQINLSLSLSLSLMWQWPPTTALMEANTNVARKSIRQCDNSSRFQETNVNDSPKIPVKTSHTDRWTHQVIS